MPDQAAILTTLISKSQQVSIRSKLLPLRFFDARGWHFSGVRGETCWVDSQDRESFHAKQTGNRNSVVWVLDGW